jgi:hypothetical protein
MNYMMKISRIEFEYEEMKQKLLSSSSNGTAYRELKQLIKEKFHDFSTDKNWCHGHRNYLTPMRAIDPKFPKSKMASYVDPKYKDSDANDSPSLHSQFDDWLLYSSPYGIEAHGRAWQILQQRIKMPNSSLR